jgi:hypothetical protein
MQATAKRCYVAIEMATRLSQTGGMTGPDDIAILRIELEDIEQLIWRRVAVRT